MQKLPIPMESDDVIDDILLNTGRQEKSEVAYIEITASFH